VSRSASPTTHVLDLYRQAYGMLSEDKHISVVSGTTHLFEEPEVLDNVERQAARWFKQNLGLKVE
jgi:hypothetical protein